MKNEMKSMGNDLRNTLCYCCITLTTNITTTNTTTATTTNNTSSSSSSSSSSSIQTEQDLDYNHLPLPSSAASPPLLHTNNSNNNDHNNEFEYKNNNDDSYNINNDNNNNDHNDIENDSTHLISSHCNNNSSSHSSNDNNNSNDTDDTSAMITKSKFIKSPIKCLSPFIVTFIKLSLSSGFMSGCTSSWLFDLSNLIVAPMGILLLTTNSYVSFITWYIYELFLTPLIIATTMRLSYILGSSNTNNTNTNTNTNTTSLINNNTTTNINIRNNNNTIASSIITPSKERQNDRQLSKQHIADTSMISHMMSLFSMFRVFCVFHVILSIVSTFLVYICVRCVSKLFLNKNIQNDIYDLVDLEISNMASWATLFIFIFTIQTSTQCILRTFGLQFEIAG